MQTLLDIISLTTQADNGGDIPLLERLCTLILLNTAHRTYDHEVILRAAWQAEKLRTITM